MRKAKVNNNPKAAFSERQYMQRIKIVHNENLNNNTAEGFGYESYQNMEKMGTNDLFNDPYLGSGEVEDQIQSYKEQLIDAKLKNIKLTNEVQKLKELSKTQMNNFYNNGLNNPERNEEIQNQTDSMFYKSNNK